MWYCALFPLLFCAGMARKEKKGTKGGEQANPRTPTQARIQYRRAEKDDKRASDMFRKRISSECGDEEKKVSKGSLTAKAAQRVREKDGQERARIPHALRGDGCTQPITAVWLLPFSRTFLVTEHVQVGSLRTRLAVVLCLCSYGPSHIPLFSTRSEREIPAVSRRCWDTRAEKLHRHSVHRKTCSRYATIVQAPITNLVSLSYLLKALFSFRSRCCGAAQTSVPRHGKSPYLPITLPLTPCIATSFSLWHTDRHKERKQDADRRANSVPPTPRMRKRAREETPRHNHPTLF